MTGAPFVRVVWLPTGHQVLVREWPEGHAEAAWRSGPDAVWGRPWVLHPGDDGEDAESEAA